jgi:AcrR family transcriptional regulator
MIPGVESGSARSANQERRVLEAAMLAISEVGVDGLRMTDISARAGMSAGHILYYFGRKDRILIETLRWSENDLRERRRRILDRVADPHRRLRRFVEFYLPRGKADPRWNLWAQVWARPPEDRETLLLLDELAETWRVDLAEVIDDGVAAGRFAAADSSEVAARACALMDGLATDILVGSPRATRGQAEKFVVRALERELSPS